MAVEKARKQIASITNAEIRQTPNKRGFQTIQNPTPQRSSSRTSKNLPIAKAYEGSDSGEDIDSFHSPEKTETVVVNQNLKVHLQKAQPNSQKSVYVPKIVAKMMEKSESGSTSDQEERTVTVTDIKFGKGFQDPYSKNDLIEDEMSPELLENSGHSNTSSDASSIIYRPKKGGDNDKQRKRYSLEIESGQKSLFLKFILLQ
jgi:hypothetical protein